MLKLKAVTWSSYNWLFRHHVVFGQVISGQEVVREIENQKTDAASKPFAEVRILSCGELIPKSKGKNKYMFLIILMHAKQAETF